MYALSKPFPESLPPKVSPIPAKSVTGLSDMGSAMKFLCFCDVVDIFFFGEDFLYAAIKSVVVMVTGITIQNNI